MFLAVMNVVEILPTLTILMGWAASIKDQLLIPYDYGDTLDFCEKIGYNNCPPIKICFMIFLCG